MHQQHFGALKGAWLHAQHFSCPNRTHSTFHAANRALLLQSTFSATWFHVSAPARIIPAHRLILRVGLHLECCTILHKTSWSSHDKTHCCCINHLSAAPHCNSVLGISCFHPRAWSLCHSLALALATVMYFCRGCACAPPPVSTCATAPPSRGCWPMHKASLSSKVNPCPRPTRRPSKRDCLHDAKSKQQ